MNAVRGYEASVPVEKIWSKFEDGSIEGSFCIPLGEDSTKMDHALNLDTRFHILVAGAALSGAGMFRRVALATLLKFNSPEDLQCILIDPLKLFFFHFKNIDKYLAFPIIKECDEALKALEWARVEMERRYEVLVENKFRTIRDYNERYPEKKIPKIVIFITELGELMDFDQKGAGIAIVRVAQMSKAVGIHFILTTQRPSDDVLTELIKSNIPAHIAFHSGSKDGSIAILDKEGAEDLLGQGDMIVQYFNEDSQRLQGYCLEEEAVEKMIF